MSKKILFFGNEKLATGISTEARVFNGLLEADYEIDTNRKTSLKNLRGPIDKEINSLPKYIWSIADEKRHERGEHSDC